MIHGSTEVEEKLRAFLARGDSLAEAIRNAFRDGYGLLLLVEPVASITNLCSSDARKLVFEETKGLRSSGSGGDRVFYSQ